MLCKIPGDVVKRWNQRYFVLLQTAPTPLLLYYRNYDGVRLLCFHLSFSYVRPYCGKACFFQSKLLSATVR